MRSIVFASITLVFVAVAAPKFLDVWIESRSQRVAEDGTRGAQAAGRRNRGRGDVEIRSAANGHFYLDAEIDGRDVPVVVDTGASVVALRESDARRAGIRVRRSDFNVSISTANGETYAAPVTLRSVAVDDIEIRNVRAVVVPDEQLAISLLGASFLNELRRFEISDNTLIIEN